MVTFFDILAVFATPYGIGMFLIGLLMFFGIPLLAAITPFKWPSHMMFALATAPLRRAAVVISESNDAVFKTMQFTEPGVETIQLGDEEKSFSDPDAALHWWRGVRFALADEPDGILFDPRHAAIGKAKALYDEHEATSYQGTDDDWTKWDITTWKPAVFELPTQPVLQNLSYVRELVDGGERAEYPQRVESFYKHSRNPFQNASVAAKFMYPILGFAIPFFGIWILASQLGTPSGGATSSVTFGTLGLLITRPPITKARLKHAITKTLTFLFGAILFIGVPAAGFYALYTFVSPVAAIALYAAFFIGFGILPFFSILVRLSTRLSAAFANLFLRLGFLGYREPVFQWQPDSYQLVEYSSLEDAQVDCWYGLFGSKVGFTYDVDGDPFDDSETYTPAEVEAYGAAELEADGGTRNTTHTSNLPARWTPAPSIKRDGMGGFVPRASRVDDDTVYLKSANALSRFRNSADGQKSMERLLLAKEKWGGDNSLLSDKTVLYLTFATTVLGAFMGVFFFVA